MPIYRIEGITGAGSAVVRYATDAPGCVDAMSELERDETIVSVTRERRRLPRTKRELVELLEAWA